MDMDLNDLIGVAELIVLGQVEVVYPSRWNTPDGKLPEGMTIYTLSPDVLPLFTDVEFRIGQTLKGDAGGKERVRVRTIGGEYEGMPFRYQNLPLLDLGQKYLLFLERYPERPTAPIDPDHYVITDAFAIADGQAIAMKHGGYDVPLEAIPFLLRMPQGNPFLVGRRVSLAEAQAEFGWEVPLPQGREVREVWVAREACCTHAVAVWFDDGLWLVMRNRVEDRLDVEELLERAPEMAMVEVKGYPGGGGCPGVIEKDGRQFSHLGNVTVVLKDCLTLALYSDSLSLGALLEIAEMIPLPAPADDALYIRFDPLKLLDLLKAGVEARAAGQIDRDIAAELQGELDSVLDSLNEWDVAAAIDKLNTFINEVSTQRGQKIAGEAASGLISQAYNIIDVLRVVRPTATPDATLTLEEPPAETPALTHSAP